MRDGNGVGSFILGLGLGAVAGVAVNRWLENGKNNEYNTESNSNIHLDRQDIAHLAEQFIDGDQIQNTVKEV